MNVFVRLLCAAAAALACAGAHAQAYPAKPVRVIIPYPTGGGAEGAARLAANHLSKVMGQSFVIDPRPGGNTLIGTEAAAKSAPDGYTLLVTGGSTMSLQPFVFAGKLPFDPLADFAPIGMVSRFPFFLVVPASLNVQTYREFADLVKSKPGQLSYGSNGTGNLSHLGTEMLKAAAGLDMVHVPYKGFGPMLPDLLTGRLASTFADYAPVAEQVRAGKLRILATTGTTRSPYAPDAPPLAELGNPGYEFEVWFALYAPAKTPSDIVARLSEELRKYLSGAEAKEAFAKLGHDTYPSGPDEVRNRIVAEHKLFAVAVKTAKLKD